MSISFVGGEERALWAGAATCALGRLIPEGPKVVHTNELRAAILREVEAYADGVLAAYRRRDGSHP